MGLQSIVVRGGGSEIVSLDDTEDLKVCTTTLAKHAS